MMDDEEIKPVSQIIIGEDLAMMSVGELTTRVTRLREEIERIEAAINAKQDSKVNADNFFKI